MRLCLILMLFCSEIALASPQVFIRGAPPARQTTIAPQGHERCYIKQSSFDSQGIWREQHRVCEYRGPRGGRVTWTSGYWACSKFSHHHTKCKHWTWVQGSWVDKNRVRQVHSYHH